MSKNIILSNVEKFLKKEAETHNHTDDKQQKWKTALKYLAEDDCFVIYDTECSIKCVFDEDNFKRETEKKGKSLEGNPFQDLLIDKEVCRVR